MSRRQFVPTALVSLTTILSLACDQLTEPSLSEGPIQAPQFGVAGTDGTITQLSSGSPTSQQNSAAISGTQVVWTEAVRAGGPVNFDIVLRDLIGGSTVSLTNTPTEQEFLEDIDAGNVVWVHTSDGRPGDLVLYQTATGVTTIIGASSAAVQFEQPAIRGRYVTALRVTPSQVDVVLFDILLGSMTMVTNDAAVQGRARVGGDLVVFEDFTNGNADIRAWRISTGGPAFDVASGPGNQAEPDIDGNTIVYTGVVGFQSHVFAFDVPSSSGRQLTSSPSFKMLPRISGARVVWTDDRGGDLDLFTHNLATDIEEPLVIGPGDQFLADIDGDRVAYTDNVDGFEQVYLFTFGSAPPVVPPSVESAGTVRNGTSVVINAVVHAGSSPVSQVAVMPTINAVPQTPVVLTSLGGDAWSGTIPGVSALDVVSIDFSVEAADGAGAGPYQLPVASNGGNRTVPCQSDRGASVTLDGSGSTGPSDVPVSYQWSGPFGSASGVTVTASFGVGPSTVTLVLTDGRGSTGSQAATITVDGSCVSTGMVFGPARIWLGLHDRGRDDHGRNNDHGRGKDRGDDAIRLDIQAKVWVNGTVVSTGLVNNVRVHGSGFDDAILQAISLTATPADVPRGAKVTLGIQARRTCTVSGRDAARVKLWFNGVPVDAGRRRDAGSRLETTVGGTATPWYLRPYVALTTTSGSSRTALEFTVNSHESCPSRSFVKVGTWSFKRP